MKKEVLRKLIESGWMIRCLDLRDRKTITAEEWLGMEDGSKINNGQLQ